MYACNVSWVPYNGTCTYKFAFQENLSNLVKEHTCTSIIYLLIITEYIAGINLEYYINTEEIGKMSGR